MKILECNRQILERKFPQAVVEIEKEFNEDVYIGKAQNNEQIIIVRHENRLWHLNSRYNATEAAMVYAERYKIHSYGTYFIFGMSDGRHIRAILNNCDDTNVLIICEPSIEILANACAYFDISDILEDKRVLLYVPGITEKLETIMRCRLQYSNFTSVDFCILPGYDILFRDICRAYEDAIVDKMRDEAVKKSTSLHFNRAVPQNTLYNMKNMINHRNIAQIRKQLNQVALEDIPVIIVSAGPSLDKNIHELKKAEGKAFIIVVDAALRAVIRAGIQPDMVCTVDANVPERFFSEMDLTNIIWGCESTTRPSLMEKFGRRIYYFGAFEKRWNGMVSELIGEPFPVLETGGSVSTVAFCLAVYVGFRKIILIGQDLAFTGGKSHTSGIQGALGDNDAYIKKRFLMEVEGLNGEVLQTDFQMWYYKKWFEKVILDNKDALTVIDATEGGAKIEGAECRRLCDVIETECNQDFNFRDIDACIPEAFSEQDKQYLYEQFENMKVQARELRECIEQEITLQEAIQKQLKCNANITENIIKDLNKMLEGNDKLEHMPLFDMMITYAQKEEYELGDNIYREEDMSVEDLVEQSLKLFYGYRNAVKMLIEDIEET